MIKKQGQPISGGAGQFRTNPNVLTDSAATSRDAQKLVRSSPQPFQNRQGSAKLGARTNSAFRSSANPKELLKHGGAGRSVSIRNAPDVNMAAVGYSAGATKSTNPIISGFPTRNTARRVGAIQLPGRSRG
jgi:hypothetical protein